MWGGDNERTISDHIVPADRSMQSSVGPALRNGGAQPQMIRLERVGFRETCGVMANVPVEM